MAHSLQILQSGCIRSDDGTAILQLAVFTNDNDDDIMTGFLLIILIPLVLFLDTNQFFITIKTLERAAGRSFDPSLSGMGIDDLAAVLHFVNINENVHPILMDVQKSLLTINVQLITHIAQLALCKYMFLLDMHKLLKL